MPNLPIPSEDALAHSQRVTDFIKQRISQAGGWLSFAEFMSDALYAPSLGYYSAGSQKFGVDGDFTTAPEMTPLFATAIAHDLAPILAECSGTLIECGAGSGRLAGDLLHALAQLNALPDRYQIIELSADLAERQRQHLARVCPQWLPRVEWLHALPKRIHGIVLGNEVLDAMPCELVERDAAGGIQHVGVTWHEHHGFEWALRPLSNGALFEEAKRVLPQEAGYRSEIHLAAQAFIRTLGERLERGAILLFDYGFPEHEFYHAQRHQGTLMCHYRHHSHDDPFLWPGLQDITVHIDFTAIAQAGVDCNLDLIGYTTQAHYLTNAGILQALSQSHSLNSVEYLNAAAMIQKLLSPAEMGELFKVIALGRGVSGLWRGFERGDLCYRL